MPAPQGVRADELSLHGDRRTRRFFAGTTQVEWTALFSQAAGFAARVLAADLLGERRESPLTSPGQPLPPQAGRHDSPPSTLSVAPVT